MTPPSPDDEPRLPGPGRPCPPDSLDRRLTRQVSERLHLDGDPRYAAVAVEVQNGVAILDGAVGSARTHRAAGDAARAVPGVRDVCNRLRTRGGPPGPAGSPTTARGSSPAGRPPLPRRTVALLALALAAVWILLGLLIAALGLAGVLIGCLGAAATLEAVHARRDRLRRQRHP